MTREVYAVGPGTLLLEAARLMAEHDIGFLPVIDGGVLVGVVTDRDIVVRGTAEGALPTQAKVGDIMSIEIVCCFAHESTETIKRLMAEHGFSRLPVINEQHALVGLISSSTVDGPPASRKKGLHVKFQKDKTDSYGRPHKVPVKTIYITGKALLGQGRRQHRGGGRAGARGRQDGLTSEPMHLAPRRQTRARRVAPRQGRVRLRLGPPAGSIAGVADNHRGGGRVQPRPRRGGGSTPNR
ncbi:MAG: CBS domain-containing protein [Rhodospirillales bacterium]|nr:CBS domain-containing protein [Rhodospirillales bacterium]